MRIISFASGASALALIALPSPVHADAAETDDGASILVVGQRDAPITIEPRGLSVSLGEEQFEGVNAFNVEDLMKYAPNFFVRTRYRGDSNGVPGFRGTHSTQSARALVMVDGFVVSNFLGNSFGFAPKWGVVGPGEVQQFDIVYGPYSSRYSGNSMGGIVNITTRDPQEPEAFATVQGFVQPYEQFGTDENYYGYSAEAGLGWKQRNGPFSVRLTGRYFRNDGQPQVWYGLRNASGTATPVTGAVVDPKQEVAGVPGHKDTPIFAAQSSAAVTQQQAKLKVGYDDGDLTGQLLFAYWHNEDKQYDPDCYLKDANGNKRCEGLVSFNGTTYRASGANWSKTLRDEYLAGLKLAAPVTESTNVRLNLSTYRIARSDGFTSSGYEAGETRGAGSLAEQGPTGWYTADFTVENKSGRHELAAGLTANLYETDQTRYTLANWTSKAGKDFSTRTFGKTRTLSGWVEARFLMAPLTVTMGARWDDWRAFDGGLIGTATDHRYGSRNEQALNPSISAEYRLSDGTLIQLSLAQASRFPTVGELFQGSLDSDGMFDEKSFDPNLKTERSRDANLLIGHDFGFLSLTGSLFYQRVKDAIFSFSVMEDSVLKSRFRNIDLTRQYGVELIAQTRNWPVEGMSIEANGAYIDARTLKNDAAPDAEGVQFPRIPKWRANANLRYDLTPSLQGSFGLRYASRPNTDLFGRQRGDTFGYTSELFALDARVNWALNDQFRVSAGVDNITNDKAWVYHPYPQRTFVIETSWRL